MKLEDLEIGMTVIRKDGMSGLISETTTCWIVFWGDGTHELIDQDTESIKEATPVTPLL